MKLTSTQLRQIIKEEIENVTQASKKPAKPAAPTIDINSFNTPEPIKSFDFDFGYYTKAEAKRKMQQVLNLIAKYPGRVFSTNDMGPGEPDVDSLTLAIYNAKDIKNFMTQLKNSGADDEDFGAEIGSSTDKAWISAFKLGVRDAIARISDQGGY